jgi:hypothetical protein
MSAFHQTSGVRAARPSTACASELIDCGTESTVRALERVSGFPFGSLQLRPSRLIAVQWLIAAIASRWSAGRSEPMMMMRAMRQAGMP